MQARRENTFKSEGKIKKEKGRMVSNKALSPLFAFYLFTFTLVLPEWPF